ncbi:splicing factor 3B subunit 5 [Platysternon megacephalum]|uniref:Splicing factor 3B subunit 5 n=1 Tax=Platysternon megacephalum TaxID=55544 RepID=A0A4D9EE55_9SAUR|nr:splicing factor 3B subunit 5 [Platysternon megacephalum]
MKIKGENEKEDEKEGHKAVGETRRGNQEEVQQLGLRWPKARTQIIPTGIQAAISRESGIWAAAAVWSQQLDSQQPDRKNTLTLKKSKKNRSEGTIRLSVLDCKQKMAAFQLFPAKEDAIHEVTPRTSPIRV